MFYACWILLGCNQPFFTTFFTNPTNHLQTSTNQYMARVFTSRRHIATCSCWKHSMLVAKPGRRLPASGGSYPPLTPGPQPSLRPGFLLGGGDWKFFLPGLWDMIELRCIHIIYIILYHIYANIYIIYIYIHPKCIPILPSTVQKV